MSTPGFCVFINTFCQGPVPSILGEGDRPFVFATRVEAEREIAEYAILRLHQFMVGARDFEDATTIEEYVVEVDVLPDGSIIDESDNHFGTSL
jgi:hypothetical protein